MNNELDEIMNNELDKIMNNEQDEIMNKELDEIMNNELDEKLFQGWNLYRFIPRERFLPPPSYQVCTWI